MWQIYGEKVTCGTKGGLVSKRKQSMKLVVTTNGEKSAEVIVCDLKVVTLIAEMLLLLSRSIPIGKCLVRNEWCEATETK